MKTSLRKSVGGSTWSRWSLAAALAAGLTLSFAPTAQAAPVLDANVSQTVATSFNSVMAFKTMAQTFTAVNKGYLTQVDLYAGTGYSLATLKIQVWNVFQGNPTAMASSVSVNSTLGFTPDWHAFPLTSTVPVTPGQQYAIVAVAGLANYFRWGYNGTAKYAGGKLLVLSGSSWSGFTNLPTGSAFNFRTWVNTASGPTLTINHDTPAASGFEGTAPTMTGTYQGATGNVTLTADHGQVVAGATAGTWKWTGDVYDEGSAAPSTVTITITDASGASKTTNFPLTIMGVKPTASISTGALKQAATLSTATASTPEGSKLTLNGSANSVDPADQAGVFTYSWTATENGVALPEAGGASYTVTTMDETDTYVVTLRVTDDGGMLSDPVSITVAGAEIKPSATITSISGSDPMLTFIAPMESLNFNGTYTDPAPEPHTFRWDFGDGGSATTQAASHAYAAGGTYTVTLTVKDDEGVAGTATATVKVLTTQQALASMIAYVQGLSSLNHGQQNSLIAKLNAASDAAGRGDNKAAGNQLNAFLNELEADLKTGKISAAAYNALRADAHALQGSLGTYNRFLEWWPLPA